MRTIDKVNYTRVPDVYEDCIYAFRDKEDIVILCRKDNRFFWKCLESVKMVWYTNYYSIGDAVEGVVLAKDYIDRKCGAIMEFTLLTDFLLWACKELEVSAPEKPVSLSDFTIKSSVAVCVIKDLAKDEMLGFWYDEKSGEKFTVRPANAEDVYGSASRLGFQFEDYCVVIDSAAYEGNLILGKHLRSQTEEEINIKPLRFVELGLNIRALNALKANSVDTIGDILNVSPRKLMLAANFGKKSLSEISHVLARYGYTMNGSPRDRNTRWVK